VAPRNGNRNHEKKETRFAERLLKKVNKFY